jgi:hypothetical protein
MKMQMSKEYFLNHIEKIHNYIISKRSQTIPQGSTSQAEGDGNGVLLIGNAKGEEIVESA